MTQSASVASRLKPRARDERQHHGPAEQHPEETVTRPDAIDDPTPEDATSHGKDDAAQQQSILLRGVEA